MNGQQGDDRRHGMAPAAASIPLRTRLLSSGLQAVGPAHGCLDEVLGAMHQAFPFSALDRDAAGRLCGFMEVYEAEPAVALFDEGDPADFMLLVTAGLVDVLRRNRNHYPARVAVAGAGEALGEMSMFDDAPRFSSCVALERTRIAVLTREGLHRFLAQDPALGNRLLLLWAQLLSQRLRDMAGRLFTQLEAARAA